jgi:all-trans-retinol 13,14-reductase
MCGRARFAPKRGESVARALRSTTPMTPRKAVVVGTGAGGLTAAAYLAKDGFDVVAFDQADRIGGFLAPFALDGYTFDPGVHYVGRARPGQALDGVLGALGIDVGRSFVEMDPDGFDAYRFPGFEVRMCRGLEHYRDRLIEAFPAERDGLRRVFEVVHRFGEVRPLLSLHQRPTLSQLRTALHLPSVLRWERATFGEFLGHYLKDPRARAVLAAPDGDVGLPPGQLGALAGIGVLDHYLDGAFFPRGGSGALRDALVSSAERHGARFRTHADVTEILVREGVVTGVRLAGGERIEADVVVSDADPTVTFGKLLARDAVPSKLRSKVERTRPSLSAFVIYLGMKRELRSRGFGSFNVWDYPSWDLDGLYAPVLAGELPHELGIFLSSSTERDDSGKLAPSGCSTLQIATFVPWEPFSAWADKPPGERGPEYRQLRQDFSDRMMEAVEKRWPGLVGDVAVQRVATPLSNTDYARGVRGGIYGPAHTPDQIGRRRFQTRTPIGGLYLTGAGVYGCGVVGCLAAGRAAAAVAVGKQPAVPERKGLRRRIEQQLHTT